MVAAELKNAVSTIRIHDEYFETSTGHCISRLNRIVSNSYKRRQLSADEKPQNIVAAQIVGDLAEA